MAITTMAGLLAALPGQQNIFMKVIPNTSANLISSTWTCAGWPLAGAAPSSGVAGDVPTNATAGALPFVNPASGITYPARMTSNAGNGLQGWLMVYDRLWQQSGLSATATTAQTVQASSPAVPLTRPDALGANVEAWWQVYAVMGAGTPSVTLTYTNQAGTTGKTGSSGLLATTMAANTTGPFQLASGDTGVRSIQTWQADSTFTSGTIGLVLRRLICAFPTVNGNQSMLSWPVADGIAAAMSAIPNSACIELLFLANGTQTNLGVALALNLVQG